MTSAEYLDIRFILITEAVRKWRHGIKGVLKEKKLVWRAPKCN